MRTTLFFWALLLALLAGCQARIDPNVPIASPTVAGNASPTIGSGNTATVPINVPTTTVTSQPADQRGTLTGGNAEAGRDQANRTLTVYAPLNISGGGWAAVGVLGLVLIVGLVLVVLILKLRGDHRRFANDVSRRLRPEWRMD